MPLQTILDDMNLLTDWEDKYSYIIDLGRDLTPLPEDDKTPENKVSGCTSQVWLTHTEESGLFTFQVASDAVIVQGLLAVLLAIFNGKPRAEIQAQDAQAILAQLGLSSHLSPNRRSGFTAVADKIKLIAG